MSFRSLVHGKRTNAGFGWALTALVALAGLWNLRAGAYVWSGLWLCIALSLAVPAAVTGDWRVIVPWPLPLCATGAVGFQTAAVHPEIAGYVAVATLALVVVIELDAFTTVEMSRRFTVVFAAMTTMAVQTWVSIAQFFSDRWFGSTYLPSQTELQWDIVSVTVVALVVSAVFVWYFERFSHVGSQARPLLPEESS